MPPLSIALTLIIPATRDIVRAWSRYSTTVNVHSWRRRLVHACHHHRRRPERAPYRGRRPRRGGADHQTRGRDALGALHHDLAELLRSGRGGGTAHAVLVPLRHARRPGEADARQPPHAQPR